MQHELDHLEGIEYVQRLECTARTEVYDVLASEGVDITDLPARPTVWPPGRG